MSLLFLIPLCPLLGFLWNGLVGPRLSARTAGWVGVAAAGGAFAAALASVGMLVQLAPDARAISASLGEWIAAGDFTADFAFRLDPLSAVMILVVTGVGFLIHVYSIGYMRGDGAEWRFFAYLNLFLVAMSSLVLGANLLVLFLGWEGVGLCSYLLIGFWFTKEAPPNAGLKAFLVNRVGDFAFIIGLLLLARSFGTLDLNEILTRAPRELLPGGTLVTGIALLLFIGATGKSAQIPLHVWLPDAMEGPTPVSALIHAATMVTAGVYLVARTHVLYLMAPTAMAVVAGIGLATALMAGTIAVTQNDVKRVLAYSTISQLGYMFLACGVGAFTAAVFHLMTHAFFKALLFLGSGSVIHAMGGEQDMRRMGGLKHHLPITYKTFLIGALAIAGIFPFAGFFSKDEILFETYLGRGPILYLFALAGAALTAFYMFRLMSLTFYGQSRLDPKVHPHESPRSMTVVLMVLAGLSVVGGWVGIAFVEGWNHFAAFLAPVFADAEHIALLAHHGEASPGLELGLAAVSLAVALLSIWAGIQAYAKKPEIATQLARRLPSFRALFAAKYHFDTIYDRLIVRPLFGIADLAYRWLDVGVVDRLVNGVGEAVRGAAMSLRGMQSGFVRRYALVIVLGVVVLLSLAGR
ncbi:MAG TPA: NADH-quinone oxidoreductase subunit L [Candidatus Udaeobacter sp.]|nr:NADH-quinone oxidoreductase subunit L [Candidatus Udaeobacter sp.]